MIRYLVRKKLFAYSDVLYNSKGKNSRLFAVELRNKRTGLSSSGHEGVRGVWFPGGEEMSKPKKKGGKKPESTDMVPVKKAEVQYVDPRTPLFQLNVGQPNPSSAIIDVTWCLNRKAYDELLEKDIKFPYMLITVFSMEDCHFGEPGDKVLKDYTREIYPLQGGMAQLRFNKPGTFRIVGSVVWSDEDHESKGRRHSRGRLWSWYLKKDFDDSRRFDRSLSHHDHFCFESLVGEHRLDWDFQVDIAVQESFFAEEPSPWLKWYGNLWCEGKPVDQCHFRRRVLWGVPKFPIVALCVLLILVLRSLTVLFAFLAGWRDIKLGALLHPFDLDRKSVYGCKHNTSNWKGYWWLSNDKCRPRHWITSTFLCPFGWALAVVTFVIISVVTANEGTSFWSFFGEEHLTETLILLFKTLVGYVALIVSVLCTGFLLTSFYETVEKVYRKVFDGNEEKRRARQIVVEANRRATEEALFKAQQARTEEFYSRCLEPLVCDIGGPKAGSIKALPKSHQTLGLRFLDFKARVCKPFRND